MSNDRFPMFAWTWPSVQDLSQSFNNGWTFGNVIQVTNQNSSNPDVEREVVSRYSYGKQIGRITDAVLALADRCPAAEKDARLVALRQIAEDVKGIKEASNQTREGKLLDELRALKRTKPKVWKDLMQSAQNNTPMRKVAMH